MRTVPDQLSDLVERWVGGWCVCRDRSWWRSGPTIGVEVRQETRRLELLLVEPDQAQLDAAATRLHAEPDVWLSTFTEAAGALVVPEGLQVVLDGEVLMTTRLDGEPREGSLAQVHCAGDRASATVTLDGVVAAQGVVGVRDQDAVFDQIRTHDDYRRRGLGTDVMTSLAAWAVGRGATTGLLAASVDGQSLYTRLGWRTAGAMTTLSGGRRLEP